MKEYQQQVQQWWREGKQVALARVIQTWGSSPRPVGSCMFISSAGEMLGSVSGGCVEGAVVREAKSVLQLGRTKRLHYGVSDDEAWAVGLSCGGSLTVLLQTWLQTDQVIALSRAIMNNKPIVLISPVESNFADQDSVVLESEIIGESISREMENMAGECLSKRISKTVSDGKSEYFVHVFPSLSKLLIIGAAHIAADLIKLAKDFNFETIVIDPRQVFAQNTTFLIAPDKILSAYPSEVLPAMTLDANTYAVILSHDPKIDDDALKILLRTSVAYIGALGSKKNHEKRSIRLREAGFSDSEIARINAPIGVDIKAQGAKEIALSIMGALIKAKNEFLGK